MDVDELGVSDALLDGATDSLTDEDDLPPSPEQDANANIEATKRIFNEFFIRFCPLSLVQTSLLAKSTQNQRKEYGRDETFVTTIRLRRTHGCPQDAYKGKERIALTSSGRFDNQGENGGLQHGI